MKKALSFRDLAVTFATKHQKAKAARESFAAILNNQINEIAIDSDLVGTFSGEVERPGSMLDALRAKIALARQASTARFLLVSEGSFSTAGGFGLIAQGIEMLLLYDVLQDVEVIEQYISWNTNYATREVSTSEELQRFLELISFGSHALVLYPSGMSAGSEIVKGITDLDEARQAFSRCKELSPNARVMAMSDMRAHLNPTRMECIARCCALLAKRLATYCPLCRSGGFGLIATVPGLPCEMCGQPTGRALAEKHACAVCKFETREVRRDRKMYADPAECHRCNP
jgi:hypothetical protein